MASGAGDAQAIEAPARSMLHVLVDTNVVLDLLLARQPWLAEAQALWEAREAGSIFCYLSATALTDIFYICRKLVGIEKAGTAVDTCLQGFSIVSVDHDVLILARLLPGNDFEDNVQIACAQSAGLDLIITRNIADFGHSPIPAVNPNAIGDRRH